MAKTETKLTQAEVDCAFASLQRASSIFCDAILEFKKVYNSDTVGLDEWIEAIADVMLDVEQDISSTFENDSDEEEVS